MELGDKAIGNRSLRRYCSQDISLLAQTKGILHYFHIKVRKGLGQHFLISEETLQLVLEAAKLSVSDVVIEVGSGLGVVTEKLAQKVGMVFAIELDERLARILKKTLSSYHNINIINKDILKIDPAALLSEVREECQINPLSCGGYKVIGNLPYNITSLSLRHFLGTPLRPKVIVVMVQKEVAEAIVAEPGDMSLLSVSVQLYGKPKIVDIIPAHNFYPEPRVSSAILKVETYDRPIISDEHGFFKLARAGFSASRKQIVNSLTKGLAIPKLAVLNLLGEAKILPQRRAETLTLEEWLRLHQIFAQEDHRADISGAG